MNRQHAVPCLLALSAMACSFEAKEPAPSGSSDDSVHTVGEPLTIDVQPGQTVFVKLASLREVEVRDPSAAGAEWDLAFTGWDVFTNSGPSGPGSGGAFGPLPSLAFA